MSYFNIWYILFHLTGQNRACKIIWKLITWFLPSKSLWSYLGDVIIIISVIINATTTTPKHTLNYIARRWCKSCCRTRYHKCQMSALSSKCGMSRVEWESAGWVVRTHFTRVIEACPKRRVRIRYDSSLPWCYNITFSTYRMCVKVISSARLQLFEHGNPVSSSFWINIFLGCMPSGTHWIDSNWIELSHTLRHLCWACPHRREFEVWGQLE